jgi:hypothetical protein
MIKLKLKYLAALLIFTASSLFAEQKLAQTGFQFLSVATEAKGGCYDFH